MWPAEGWDDNLTVRGFSASGGHWVIAGLSGKGGHIRTIPIPEWIKAAVDSWTLAARVNTGPLLRSISKTGKIWGDGFTPKVIWAIVKVNAKSCGLPTVALALHDLRRTCVGAKKICGRVSDAKTVRSAAGMLRP
jgi:hypothetical protein